ncbi:hypothetical protein VNO80_16742 [Phaseolus coccineus]|uniref:Uncharacterized protein n=1 Tax=Phaseolus coccineus TaxID=3886 RepID=A0AAN9R3J3_PHACN
MPKLFALAQAHAICVAYWPTLFTSVTGPRYLRQLSPRKSGRICVRFCVHALLRVASTLPGSSPRNLHPTLKPTLILICLKGFFVGCLADTKQTHKRPFSNFCVCFWPTLIGHFLVVNASSSTKKQTTLSYKSFLLNAPQMWGLKQS